MSSGATTTFTVSHVSPSRRANESSGTISDAAAKPAQRGDSPPSAEKAKPPSATKPEPGTFPDGSASASRATARQRAATSLNRLGPAAVSSRMHPSAASAEPARSGCSSVNHGSPGRRERATTAVGSAAAGHSAVTLASAGVPDPRARRSP